MSWLRLALVWLCWAFLPLLVAAQAPAKIPDTAGWSPRHYALELEPDFAERRFAATLRLELTLGPVVPATITMQAGDLHIERVALGDAALDFERQGPQLHIRLPQSLAPDQALVLTLRYQGQGSAGLRFDPDIPQLATAFSTSQWMPCLDDPSVRAPFTLTLRLPAALRSVGNGEPRPPVAQENGQREHLWQLTTPMPSYLYGFAAGPFEQVQQMASRTALQYLGPQPFTAENLQQVFAESADMLAFFEQCSGVAYPFATYRQVLLAGPAAQEMAGFSVMGLRYGQRVLDNPESVWLGAHEMAHQWWGNGLTNRSWRHFWLNEGIASFMTAAYLEHRFGRAAYDEQITAAQAKYDALRAQGLDKSLVFPDWDHPSAVDRSLVYDKGTLVLHELRNLLGEERFWKGLKHYTRKHWGQSVETADFQRAMEEGSGADLTAFFRQWVEVR